MIRCNPEAFAKLSMDAKGFLQFCCNGFEFFLCFLSLLKVFVVISHTFLGLFIQCRNLFPLFSFFLLFFLLFKNFMIRFQHRILLIFLPFFYFFRLLAPLVLSTHYLQRISVAFALLVFFASSLAFPSWSPSHNCQNPQQ